jgi:hypothetical protein
MWNPNRIFIKFKVWMEKLTEAIKYITGTVNVTDGRGFAVLSWQIVANGQWRIKAMGNRKAFEEKKQAALNAAQQQNIVDVVTSDSSGDGISPETVELAAKLVEKHRKNAYERLEARRKSQK